MLFRENFKYEKYKLGKKISVRLLTDFLLERIKIFTNLFICRCLPQQHAVVFDMQTKGPAKWRWLRERGIRGVGVGRGKRAVRQ